MRSFTKVEARKKAFNENTNIFSYHGLMGEMGRKPSRSISRLTAMGMSKSQNIDEKQVLKNKIKNHEDAIAEMKSRLDNMK